MTAKERFLKNSREHKEKLLLNNAGKSSKEKMSELVEVEKMENESGDEEEEAFNPADWANWMKKKK